MQTEMIFTQEVHTEADNSYRNAYQHAMKEGWNHTGRTRYPSEKLESEGADFTHQGDGGANGVWIGDEWAAYVNVSYSDATVIVWANTPELAKEKLEEMKERAPRTANEDPSKVQVQFWSLSPQGPSSYNRKLVVPSWEDIRINYPSTTLGALDKMINPDFRPGASGQLFLWHGEPGTGKTTALRALAREWRDWCDFYYIVDPEVFFGKESAYMMQVLLGGYDADESRHRMLILEDCGEMIAKDAKLKTGQGLSRLLNAVDGMIGQGLQTMVMVTTNEELGELSDAVIRPGRCAADIEFGKLDKGEIAKWLKAQGKDEGFDAIANKSALSVADLFSIDTERIDTRSKSGVGFSL
jgi:hypothetical protein